MKDNNRMLKETKLEDDALEKVSGGKVGKTTVIYKCAYCHLKHEMSCYFPWTAVYEGIKYRNAERYICWMQGDFYRIPDYNGNELYLNSTFNPIPKP